MGKLENKSISKGRKLFSKKAAHNKTGKVNREKKNKEETVQIDPEKLKKYNRGSKVKLKGIRDKRLHSKLKNTEKNYEQAVTQAARSEILNTEDSGFLQPEEGERTYKFRQDEITKELDMRSARKHFSLTLTDFAPYKIDYTRNGKFLLIGGEKGHIATINWESKSLVSEVHVKETVRDVCWLHQDQFYAAAQKKSLFIYDKKGVEIHCMRDYQQIKHLEFLPYHFLLATASESGDLKYLDTSIGKTVSTIKPKLGRPACMTSNPYNAVIQTGHPRGCVTMWAPMMKEPLVKMLCHSGPVLSIATERRGVYMATSGLDGFLKLWDIRAFKPVYKMKMDGKAAHDVAISQTGLLAASFGDRIKVFKDALTQKPELPYMSHRIYGSEISDMCFCPYEDVLGVGHASGFASLLVPGSGEANFDALEANPFETNKQRREHEVKMLLEKIQPEFITLDPTDIHRVETSDTKMKSAETDEGEEKEAFQPRHKAKGKSSSSKTQQRTQGMKQLTKRAERQAQLLRKKKEQLEKKKNEPEKTIVEKLDPFASALDRFKTKK